MLASITKLKPSMQQCKRLWLSVMLVLAQAWGSSHALAETVTVFIGITPTEFTEGFNRAARLHRFKLRMPHWPAKVGKYSATVTPGITVSGSGVSRGDGMGEIRVHCQKVEECSEAIFASAWSADPEIDTNALATYLQQVMRGEVRNASMAQAGLQYTLTPGKKTLTFTVTVDDAEEQE